MYIAPCSFALRSLDWFVIAIAIYILLLPELTLLNRCNPRNLRMALSSRATPSLAVGLLPLLC